VGSIYPKHIKTVHQLLDWRVDVSPHSRAIIDGQAELSYLDFADVVQSISSILAEENIRVGDRVALLGENSSTMAAGLFAVSRLGAAAVVMNSRMPVQEAAVILAHCKPASVIICSQNSKAAQPHIEALSALPKMLTKNLSVHIAGEAKLARCTPVPKTDAGSVDESVAVLIYTSGTTGTPKGVMLTHSNLLYVAEQSCLLRQLTEGDVVYGGLPLSHAYGLSSVLLASFWGGAALRLDARPGAENILGLIESNHVSVFLTVPSIYAQILALMEKNGAEKLSSTSLRYISCGGAPLDPPLRDAVETKFRLPLNNGFGLTETSPTVSVTRSRFHEADGSVGTPLPGVEVQIRGESGGSLPPDDIGELWVRGPNVMLGYFRDPENTAKVISNDGWFNSQDLAKMDRFGSLYIAGRKKDLIIRSGFNVYPAEVEAAIVSFQGVEQAAVIGQKQDHNENVVAFVVWKTAAAEEELKKFLQSKLAAYKVPARIISLPSFPCAPNGKVRKQELIKFL
jgi:long-chain acyl-CoA synthetase